MRIIFLYLAMGFCLMPDGWAAEQVRYDHYDPVLLNEHALRLEQQGNESTAMLLLQRATRLAPRNEMLAQNLKVLEKSKSGETHAAGLQLKHADRLESGSAIEATGLLPEPPAYWPAK